MKKIVSAIILVCLLVSANFAGDVRISAKSSLADETEETDGNEDVIDESTWWDGVCGWVNSLFV